MSIDREYCIRLDLQNEVNNSVMKFDSLDENTSNFKIQVSRANKLMNLDGIKGTLYVVDTKNKVHIVEVENRLEYFYIDLPKELTSTKGFYKCELSMIKDKKRTTLDSISYEVI